MSYINLLKTRELSLGKLNHKMSGHIKIDKFRGREVPGTGTPDKVLILHYMTDQVVFEAGDFSTAESKRQELQAELEHGWRNNQGTLKGCPRYGIELEPGKPNDMIEVSGSRRLVASFFEEPFPNLITTNGRELRGTLTTTYANAYCQIGTGTATEAPGDTALGTYDRTYDSIVTSVTGAQPSAPYYGWQRIVYRFNPPGTNDNYAEIGFAPSTVGNLFSRARIKNAGVPTTIAVDADEWLDVTYELRQYPDHLTVTSTTVDGYDVDILASLVNSTFTGIVQPARGSRYPTGGHTALESFGPLATLGLVTAKPGGDLNKYEGDNAFPSYVPSSYEQDVVYSCSISQSNFTGGIGCIYFGGTPFPSYQVKFDPPIPKTASDVLDIGWTFAWAIATIP